MDYQAVAVRLAPILTIALGVGGLGAIFAILRARRIARTTQFGVVRDRAIFRIRRLVILVVVMLLLAGASAGLWSMSVWRPHMLPSPQPTATPTLIPSPTPRTPTATPSPTPTATVTPTGTPTPIPPDTDLPAVLRVPLPASAVTPGPDAALVDLALAAGERGNEPVGPAVRFPAGTQRVYAFLTFVGMSRDVPWTHAWYGEADGQMAEVWGQVELWPYESPRGRIWRYFNCRAGSYELRIYVGYEMQQRISFVVEAE
jgi:hypothetical protein